MAVVPAPTLLAQLDSNAKEKDGAEKKSTSAEACNHSMFIVSPEFTLGLLSTALTSTVEAHIRFANRERLGVVLLIMQGLPYALAEDYETN